MVSVQNEHASSPRKPFFLDTSVQMQSRLSSSWLGFCFEVLGFYKNRVSLRGEENTLYLGLLIQI